MNKNVSKIALGRITDKTLSPLSRRERVRVRALRKNAIPE